MDVAKKWNSGIKIFFRNLETPKKWQIRIYAKKVEFWAIFYFLEYSEIFTKFFEKTQKEFLF